MEKCKDTNSKSIQQINNVNVIVTESSHKVGMQLDQKEKKNNNTNNNVLIKARPESSKILFKVKKKDMKPNIPFEKKLEKLKNDMQILKVDWRDGFCSLILDRDNILTQSMQQINKIDLYKELHINFKGEINNDAGGLIREWFTVVLKDLQKSELSKFNLNISKKYSRKLILKNIPLRLART